MIKAVIFDLDDTIFDHQYARRAALGSLKNTFPSLANQEVVALEAVHERFLQVTHSRLLEGQLTLTEARRERLRLLFEEFGLMATEKELDEGDALYRSTYDGSRRPVPGVLALIAALKTRVQIGVITNGLGTQQQEKMSFCGITEMIDAVVISEVVGFKKPSREIFEYALSELRVLPAEAIMIGDSWQSDVLGARAAGLSTVWFNRYSEACPEPDFSRSITTLEPLDRILPYFAECPEGRTNRGM